MAMGHEDDEQDTLFVTYGNLRGSAGHPFYEALEKILKAQGFDPYVKGLCESFYKQGGRPSIPPGIYFRCLLVGLFEGIDSERGIAWRVADSMSLRSFLGLPLDKRIWRGVGIGCRMLVFSEEVGFPSTGYVIRIEEV